MAKVRKSYQNVVSPFLHILAENKQYSVINRSNCILYGGPFQLAFKEIMCGIPVSLLLELLETKPRNE